MNANEEVGRMLKEVVKAYFKVLSQNLPEGNEGNNKETLHTVMHQLLLVPQKYYFFN
jgi:hypothetical protein